MKSFLVPEESQKMRADVYVAEQYPMFARSAIAKLFAADMIEINGKPEKAGYKLRINDLIKVDDSWLVEKEEDPIELEIVYEDDDVLVINKPEGVLSHSRGGLSREASVASFLRQYIDPSTTGAGRAGIVHRLDRATSGLMICAKNTQAQSFLQKQFHDRKVRKTYVALVNKLPKVAKAIIDAPIDRDPKHPKKFHVDPHGKSAVTRYEVTKSSEDAFLLTLYPETGRTHQLRVHLAYIHSPIMGDDLYGGKNASRLFLHANKLAIKIPSGELMTFESQLPKEFSVYVA